MNVNPQSSQFGEVKPWDELTEAEKASGDWIELPDVSGEPRRARLSPATKRLAEIFGVKSADPRPELFDILTTKRGTFDANGKPR